LILVIPLVASMLAPPAPSAPPHTAHSSTSHAAPSAPIAVRESDPALDSAFRTFQAAFPVPSAPPTLHTPKSVYSVAAFKEDANSPEGTRSLFQRLQRHVESDRYLETLSRSRLLDAPPPYMAPEQTAEQTARILPAADAPNETVGFIDVSDIDWWTVVHPLDAKGAPAPPAEAVADDGKYITVTSTYRSTSPSSSASGFTRSLFPFLRRNRSQSERPAPAPTGAARLDSDLEPTESESPSMAGGLGTLGGGFVLVEEEDVVEAIGEFVALYLARIPATRNLTHRELQSLLASTFSELQTKDTARRLWDWGKFLYASYGWAMTGVSVYRDPALVKAVLRAVWTASKWILMLFFV